MKAVYDACTQAGIPVPQVVALFFEGCEPCDKGVEVNIAYGSSSNHESAELIQSDWEEGFYIHLDKLPADTKLLKIMMS